MKMVVILEDCLINEFKKYNSNYDFKTILKLSKRNCDLSSVLENNSLQESFLQSWTTASMLFMKC